MEKLPDKLSELIRVGLADMRAVEKLPKMYAVDMGNWHRPDAESEKCSVCLAGAAMSITLGVEPTSNAYPHQFGENEASLRALNCCAWGDPGDIPEALGELGVNEDEANKWRNTTHCRYEEDRELFRDQLGQIADELEAAGY